MPTEVTKFLNERVRPSAERMKALRFVLADNLSKWEQIKDQIPNDDAVIDDGRAGEGVTQLTGAQIHALAGAAKQVSDLLEAASSDEAVAGAVTAAQVRPLSALI